MIANNYYVYVYLRSKASSHGKAGSPYYIGKGKDKRAFVAQRKGAARPTDFSYIAFVQEGLTEEEALTLEQYCIALYGRIDKGTGCLRNLTDGGEGVSGMSFSDETKARLSAAHKGKLMPEETKGKIAATLSGISRSQETRAKMSKARECNEYKLLSPLGQTYYTTNLSAFAREHGLQIANLSAVSRGERLTHKGWTCARVSSQARQGRKHAPSSRSKISKSKEVYRYELISPLGEVHVTCNLSAFALEHGLDQAMLSSVVRGVRRHHKGWTGRILEVLNGKTDVQ
jgi:hypothetical protein